MSELRPIVMSGPSGCGKSTLLNKLLTEYPNSFGFSVSHTTRQPREGEINGNHYHFVTRDKILKEIADGGFIEHAEFSGNIYGTSKKAVKDVLNENRVCILDVDEQGVKSMKKVDLNPLYIFIKPPSMEELRRRLQQRGTETEESTNLRMETAISAMKYAEEDGVYDFVLLNDDLDEAYDRLKQFIFNHFPSLNVSNQAPSALTPNNAEPQQHIEVEIPTNNQTTPLETEGVWSYCQIL